jgi:ATPase subunit of ABC transporter with duplicated ATPase domains
VGESAGQRGPVTVPSPLLDLDNVVAGYTAPIVGPVSLIVQRNDIVGLTGPNGSGKTTLVNAIIGTARVMDGRLRKAPGLRVNVQRQHPVRLPEMPFTGIDLLHLVGAGDRPVPDSIRAFVERRIDRLSGGQFQLLQVWACLSAAADLVILDEPTTNMDPTSKASLEAILRASHELVGSILVISHDHDFLERVTSRIVRIGT